MKLSQRLVWGILLIGSGLLAFLQSQRYVDQISASVWMGFLGVICLLGAVGYLQHGVQAWEWLFFVGIAGGLAISLAIAVAGVNKPYIVTPLFLGLMVPFAAAYWSDRARHWWALIPGSIMVFLALTTLFANTNGGPWIGALFLFTIAVIFFAVYLNNRTRIWALLVAYISAVLGLAPLMSVQGQGETWGASYYGAVFLFAVALPFLAIYWRTPARWWAIIPAGVLTTLAIIVAMAIAGFIRSQTEGIYANAVILFGLVMTFGIVGWRHAKRWAKIVAVILAVAGVGSIFFASNYQVIAPIAFILVGAFLLFTALRPKQST